jgi:hypothetical protein
MRLLDPDPHFLWYTVETADSDHGCIQPDGITQWGGFDVDSFHYIDRIADADGITFLCPKCFEANGGSIGTHSVQIYFRSGIVPSDLGRNREGQTVRWSVTKGTGYDDLVLSPSILLLGGCGWHGFIGAADGSRPGEVVTC